MPEFQFKCPVCNASVEADETARGVRLQCPSCSSRIIVPEISLDRGMAIGDYSLERRLGAGAMGDVWLATQSSLRRKVALKILSPSVTKDPEFVNRFLHEMRLVAKLSHPNIVTAYDSGFDKGLYFLAEEFVDGGELKTLLRIEKAIPERKALLIIRKIAEALQYAWVKFKILHRDIKPANIMMDSNGEPKLMDLGISKCLSEENSMTMTGVVMGTPDYMSPEQGMADRSMDFRADVYSLGATLYHITTGGLPYDGATPMAVISMHMMKPLPPPRDRNPNLSLGCESLIKTMMAKKREDRQESWEEVISDIDLVLDGKLPATPVPEEGKHMFAKSAGLRRKDLSWTHILIACGLLVIALTAVLLFVSQGSPDFKTPDKPRQIATPPEPPAATPSAIQATPRVVTRVLTPVSTPAPISTPAPVSTPAPF